LQRNLLRELKSDPKAGHREPEITFNGMIEFSQESNINSNISNYNKQQESKQDTLVYWYSKEPRRGDLL